MQSIGLAAPAILLFARLIQGLSLGGEYGTSATYLVGNGDTPSGAGSIRASST